MSEKLAKAIEALRTAVIALDRAEAQYLKFSDYDSPALQIQWAQRYKPTLVAAERQLIAACDALKAAGWVKPRALLPEPGQDLVRNPAADLPTKAHEQPPQDPDQNSDQR